MAASDWTSPADRQLTERIEQELPGLLALARRLAGDEQDARDAVQDTVERAWRRRRQLRDPVAAGAWLRQILARRIVDLSRRRRTIVLGAPAELEYLLPSVDDPASVVAAACDEMVLRAALRDLTAADRMTVVLHDAEGWQAAELAHLMDISTDAAHKRIQRARVRLINALASERTVSSTPTVACRHARARAHDLLDDTLDTATGARVMHHLQHCPQCPAALQAAAGVLGALGRKGHSAAAAEAMHARVERLLRAAEEAR